MGRGGTIEKRPIDSLMVAWLVADLTMSWGELEWWLSCVPSKLPNLPVPCDQDKHIIVICFETRFYKESLNPFFPPENQMLKEEIDLQFSADAWLFESTPRSVRRERVVGVDPVVTVELVMR